MTDDGSGMDEQVVERIFEPFFTTKEVGQGTGMGMSVLHAIMDSHKGHVLIDTMKGQGTSFRLLFPPAKQQLEHGQPDEHAVKRQPARGDKQHIMIVDDEHALAEFLQELLCSNGYECTSITHSPQALKHFQQYPGAFDLIITDQTMPDITGLELITQIRQLNPSIPIILTTGYSDAISREQAAKLNIDFMDKPVSTEQLLYAVSNLLHSRKMRTTEN